MKIHSINNYNCSQNIQNKNNFNGKYPNPTKSKSGIIFKTATTFGLWFGFGIGLDFITRKIHFSKSPLKNSLTINGILALIAASVTLVSNLFNNRG